MITLKTSLLYIKWCEIVSASGACLDRAVFVIQMKLGAQDHLQLKFVRWGQHVAKWGPFRRFLIRNGKHMKEVADKPESAKDIKLLIKVMSSRLTSCATCIIAIQCA